MQHHLQLSNTILNVNLVSIIMASQGIQSAVAPKVDHMFTRDFLDNNRCVVFAWYPYNKPTMLVKTSLASTLCMLFDARVLGMLFTRVSLRDVPTCVWQISAPAQGKLKLRIL